MPASASLSSDPCSSVLVRGFRVLFSRPELDSLPPEGGSYSAMVSRRVNPAEATSEGYVRIQAEATSDPAEATSIRAEATSVHAGLGRLGGCSAARAYNCDVTRLAAACIESHG